MATVPKLHLLVFADNKLCKVGINNYTNMGIKLINQAHQLSIFSKIHVYTAEELCKEYPEYQEKHFEFYKKILLNKTSRDTVIIFGNLF
jgi:hypothetical protein